jgi:glyoxylase-like metal-dependent hydrolase (beta-lactamase superfamily II)
MRVPAAAFGTNCYVVAPADGEECLVVDPGIGVLDGLSDALRDHGLRPAAVLLTHGHLDHVCSVVPVCGAHGVAVHIHPDDRYLLRDPLAGLGPDLRPFLEQQFGAATTWAEPDAVLPLGDVDELVLAGMTVRVTPAPGHTAGSVLFSLPGAPSRLEDRITGDDPAAAGEYGSTVLAGDVLFAGSIGRTDLPGGDPAVMWRTLRERVLTLPDDTLVLPGHGPATSIAHERRQNPFLLQAAHPTCQEHE